MKLPDKPAPPPFERILVDANLELEAELQMPKGCQGLVIFAHGSGSGRHSPRNQFVAQELRKYSLGTLLVDLLSEEEDVDSQNRFDIPLLTERLKAVTNWARQDERTKDLHLGYFGASTGAAAAVFAAVKLGQVIEAIVSRGGRVDLASEAAVELTMPTMLIVGQNDFGVLEANQDFLSMLKCQKEIAVVPGATHLFEEPGALESVAKLAAKWFGAHLTGSSKI